jgi:DNA invertase Pin-like site-specific DNA recombinase
MTDINYNKIVKDSTTPLCAATYTRVSTQEQATEGVSLDAQRIALQTYAKLKNWQIVDNYEDGGFSGGTDERPSLQHLMLDARSGRINVVMVAKLDRFFRNLRHLLNYVHELDELGITFVAVQEGLDTSTPMGKFTLQILGVISEFERGRISERMKDTRHHRVSLGQWSSGRTPFGYRFNKTNKELEIFEVEANVVRFIFDTYTSRSVGLLRLAELLNEKQFITPRMGRRKHTAWTKNTVHSIIKHPGYGGGPNTNWVFNTPAIVDSDTWNAAQKRLANNRRFQPSRHVSEYQGKLKCALCGHTMRIGYCHGKRVWECPGRLKALHMDGSPRCILPRFNAPVLEMSLDKQIRDLNDDPEIFAMWVKNTIDSLESEKRELEFRLKPIETEKIRIQEDMAILDARLTMRRITPEDYKSRMRECERKLHDLGRRQSEADPLLLHDLNIKKVSILAHKLLLKHSTPEGVDFGQFSVDFRNEFRKNSFSWINEGDEIKIDFANGAHSLPYMGLVYPERVELKGNIIIGQSLVSSGCRSGHFRRFRRTASPAGPGSP